jgi:hypothetical protein
MDAVCIAIKKEGRRYSRHDFLDSLHTSLNCEETKVGRQIVCRRITEVPNGKNVFLNIRMIVLIMQVDLKPTGENVFVVKLQDSDRDKVSTQVIEIKGLKSTQKLLINGILEQRANNDHLKTKLKYSNRRLAKVERTMSTMAEAFKSARKEDKHRMSTAREEDKHRMSTAREEDKHRMSTMAEAFKLAREEDKLQYQIDRENDAIIANRKFASLSTLSFTHIFALASEVLKRFCSFPDASEAATVSTASSGSIASEATVTGPAAASAESGLKSRLFHRLSEAKIKIIKHCLHPYPSHKFNDFCTSANSLIDWRNDVVHFNHYPNLTSEVQRVLAIINDFGESWETSSFDTLQTAIIVLEIHDELFRSLSH